MDFRDYKNDGKQLQTYYIDVTQRLILFFGKI
jgi:hypothetical protein